jgi:hypothetical protein
MTRLYGLQVLQLLREEGVQLEENGHIEETTQIEEASASWPTPRLHRHLAALLHTGFIALIALITLITLRTLRTLRTLINPPNRSNYKDGVERAA